MTEQPHEGRSAFPDGRSEECQPAWRRDFPIDLPQDQYVARRDFVKFLGLTSLAFVVGQLWIGVRSWRRRLQGQPPLQAIASLTDLPIGSIRSFSYPGPDDFCLLLRPAKDTLLAYNQKCTHLSCAVAPDLAAGCLNCPCHHGVFDLTTGRPIAGPPRRPLPAITLQVRDDVIYATGVELRTT